MSKKKVLELFAGSRSIGKVADELGYDCFSTDINSFLDIDLVKDIADLNKKDIPFIPDIIWASPVCSAWSKTGWFHYWDTKVYSNSKLFVAKKEFAKESIEMIRKTIEIFSWFPNAVFFMENPQGLLYRHPVINNFVTYGLSNNLKRHLITYCQYGDNIMKPTHLWTNSNIFMPKRCNKGDSCHESSPRGTMTGIRKKKNSYERSKMPYKLCLEILQLISPTKQ